MKHGNLQYIKHVDFYFGGWGNILQVNKYFIQRFGQLEFLISKMKEEGITTEEAQLNHLGGQFIIA